MSKLKTQMSGSAGDQPYPSTDAPRGPSVSFTPYRAKRDTLGEKRRVSRMQTAHNTNERLHITQSEDCA